MGNWELNGEHYIINLFTKKSIIDPLIIRLTLEFALNALFYTDSYIKNAVSKKIQGEEASFDEVEDISKRLFAFAVTIKIIAVPLNFEQDFNDALITEDIEKLKKQNPNLKKIKFRYIIFEIFVEQKELFLKTEK